MKKTHEDKTMVDEWLALALVKLMRKDDFEAITMTQIAKTAGVSRMTLYRHCLSKTDILVKYTDILSERLSKGMQDGPDRHRRPFWDALYHFIYDNRAFFIALVDARESDLILDAINRVLTQVAPPREDPYYLQIIAGAIYNVVVLWIKDGLKTPPDDLAQHVQNIMSDEFFQEIIKQYIRFFNEVP